MIYPKDFEHKIGFTALREILESRCSTVIGKESVGKMKFLSDKGRILPLLQQTYEMMQLDREDLSLSIDSSVDPRELILQIKAEGSYLPAEKFFSLSKLLQTFENVRSFFTGKSEEFLKRFSNIAALVAEIDTFVDLRRATEKVVNQYGEVKDDASPELYDIRRSIKAATSSMSGIMRRVIDRAVKSDVVPQDTVASMRDGRLVIPVEASRKRQISGIIQGSSATGKTYFIEPAEIVEAGNRLRELQMEERKEVIAILTNLASLYRPHSDEIISAAFKLGNLDFIKAKAKVAAEFDCQMPHLSSRPELDWYGAVHPMLLVSLRAQGREAVRLDISLNEKNRILIISGPNAGGKSVCLTTVAIVQYMMQCGMLPALYSNSHMGIFRNVFIDIGDEQSIENDLSTYSSHLRNMKFCLAHASDSTIFLADEMGSGTEPQIGGCIAQAILYKLNKMQVYGVVTTHYQNLKQFANTEPGFVNGAMLYDREHLQPLFRLSIGSPGSSFALEIARKSGLPSDVIEMAKECVGADYVNTDKFILDLQRDKNYWQQKRQSVKSKEAQADKLLDTLNLKAEEIKERKSQILKGARAEAEKILKEANAKIERAVKEIKESNARKESVNRVRQEIADYKKSLEGTAAEDSLIDLLEVKHKRKKKKQVAAENNVQKPRLEFNVGDYVKLKNGSGSGKILSINKNKYEVSLGAFRSWVEADKLEHDKPRLSAKTGNDSVSTLSANTLEDSRRRQLEFKNEIDVRGFRADEALQAITYFIDDAVQFGATRLRILHGTGTGALRVAIRNFLQSYPDVKSFHDEDVRFGGAGVTVVNL